MENLEMQSDKISTGVEDRFRTVRLSSLNTDWIESFSLRVAGVRVTVSFDAIWANEVRGICLKHWEDFVETAESFTEVELNLAPAEDAFAYPQHPIWNAQEPFQTKFEDEHGAWIFHRDFTCLVDGSRLTVWMARPSLLSTDALDNVLAFAIRPLAEKRETFLFHAAIVEHEGKAVVFFGPSGIGKSTLAKLSLQLGYRVMASDQGYLQIQSGKLIATASPTCNPDIPRDQAAWSIGPLEVKAVIALARTGALEIRAIDRMDFARRFFAEIFRDPNDEDFAEALKFASDVAMLKGPKLASLSYPEQIDFWPSLSELGYI